MRCRSEQPRRKKMIRVITGGSSGNGGEVTLWKTNSDSRSDPPNDSKASVLSNSPKTEKSKIILPSNPEISTRKSQSKLGSSHWIARDERGRGPVNSIAEQVPIDIRPVASADVSKPQQRAHHQSHMDFTTTVRIMYLSHFWMVPVLVLKSDLPCCAFQLFWKTIPVTVKDGVATVKFDLSDSVTTFRAMADVLTNDGLLGQRDTLIDCQLPTYAEVKLPVEVKPS